jgi:hypothetical protein
MVMNNFKLSLLLVAVVTVSSGLKASAYEEPDKKFEIDVYKYYLKRVVFTPCEVKYAKFNGELESLDQDGQIAALRNVLKVSSVPEARAKYGR